MTRVSYQGFLPELPAFLPDEVPAGPSVRWTKAKDARQAVTVRLSKEQAAWLRAAGAGTSPDDVVRALVDVAIARTDGLASVSSRRDLRASIARALGAAAR